MNDWIQVSQKKVDTGQKDEVINWGYQAEE